jgi:excisionase family DNA binding protein
MKPAAQKLSYTVDEFCAATGITRTALYAAISKSQIKTFKVGRRRMVSKASAEEYLKRLEAKS